MSMSLIKQTNKQTNRWKRSKNILFKNSQLYWIDLLKKQRTETRLYPCRPQPVRISLQFKIVYTNIALVLKSWIACAISKKNSTISICILLNGKGGNWFSLYGYSLVSVSLHNCSIQCIYIAGCFCSSTF